MNPDDTPSSIREEILDYYNRGKEVGRLVEGIGPLELLRTQELVARYLPTAPAVVYDIGGGPGVYSLWLARLGHQVHLVDATPLHVEQAQAGSQAQPEQPLASTEVGDARQLRHPDECADAVLLHGPLYHLLGRSQRLEALCEARRILKPGGVLAAVGITRYASTFVGLTRGWLDDPAYLEMIEHELETGEHLQPPEWPNLFTTAYFHRAEELKAEIEEAGLKHEITLAIEGPGWLVPDFETHWDNGSKREALLKVVRWMEREPVAIGLSPHILAVAYA